MPVIDKKIKRGEKNGNEKKIWQKIAYFLSFGILLFVAVVLESSCLSLFGKAPALSLAIVSAIGFIMGERFGALWGIAGGIMTSLLGGVGFSFAPVIYMLCGYFCGALVGWFLSKNLLSFVLYAFAAGLLREISTIAYFVLFSKSFSPIKVLTGVIIPEYLAYILFILPAYFAVLAIFSLFKGKEKRENTKI